MDYKFINMEYLDSVSAGDADIINEILNIFREQSAEIYLEMKCLHAAKNYPALGLLAHKAKSSVAIMGMEEMAKILKTFELNAKEGKDSHLYESYIENFQYATTEAVKELEDVVKNRLKA